ncbi:MAG: DUF2953 domain-containing protein [bacterium]
MGFAEFELIVLIKFIIKLFFRILAGIIITLLIILLSVIFSRINLKLTGSKGDTTSNDEDNNVRKFLFNLKVSYLFGIIKLDFDNTNDTQVVKLFGFKLEKIKYIFKRDKNNSDGDGDGDSEDRENSDINNSSDSNSSSDSDSSSEEIIYTTQSVNSEDSTHPQPEDEAINNDNGVDEEDNSRDNNKNININMEDVQNAYNNKFFQFFKTKIVNVQAIIDKIKQIINYPDKVEMLNAFKDSIKKLFKAITFKEISINVDYGLDEPHKTGTIAGIISAILPIMADTHYETINFNPHFEEEVLEGDFNIECHTTLFRLIKPVVSFLINSPIRNLLKNKGSSKKKFRK